MFTDPDNPDTRTEATIAQPPTAGERDEAASPLRQARARWAALKRQADEMEAEIDRRVSAISYPCVKAQSSGSYFSDPAELDRIFRQAMHRCPQQRAELEREHAALSAQLAERWRIFDAACEAAGVPPLRAELAQIEAAIDAVLEEIAAAPIAGAGDVAVLLDVSLGEDEIEPRIEPDHAEAPRLLRFLARALDALAPAGFGYFTLSGKPYTARPVRLADLLAGGDGAAGAAASPPARSADETQLLAIWRTLRPGDQADMETLLQLPEPQRSAMLRLLDGLAAALRRDATRAD